MTRVALYARVSSERQEREETVESQLDALRTYAQRKGYDTPTEFVDEARSGYDLARPALDRLRDAVARGDVDVIVIHEIGRLSRDRCNQALLLKELRRRARLEFVQHPSDASPQGELIENILGDFADFEGKVIRDRMRRGKLFRAREGALMGGFVPYGFRYVARSGSRRATLTIDDDRADVVREMFRLLVEDRQSCRQIARVLTERGLPAPAGGDHWRASTVGRMLRQEGYAGRFLYARNAYVKAESAGGSSPSNRPKTVRQVQPTENWVAIRVPVIIDEATFKRARQQLAENFRFSPRNNKRHSYLLSGGLVRCPSCGAAMSGAVSHGRRLYRCSAADPLNVGDRRACRYPTPAVRAEGLEEAVWDAVREAREDPGTLMREYQRRIDTLGADSTDSAQRREAERRRARLRSQQKRLVDLYQYGELDQTDLRQRLAELKDHLGRLEADLAAQADRRSGRDYWTAVLQSLEAFTARVSEGIGQLDFDGRRQVVRLLVRRVIIDAGGGKVQVVLALPQSAIEDGGHGRGSSQGSARLRPTGRDSRIEAQAGCRERAGRADVHQDGARPHPLRRHRQGAALKPSVRGVGVDPLAAGPLSQVHNCRLTHTYGLLRDVLGD